MTILYYVHDPMCSWCWGFRPVWEDILTQLPKNIEVKYLLGGLAPDSNEPMPQSMQDDIAGYWRKIQKHIPNTQFNFDFWQECEPRRSTYPACRAVIATRTQQPELEQLMIKAIQVAYYLKAQNPSDDKLLINLAVDLDLDKAQFKKDLSSQDTQTQLLKEIQFATKNGAQGFPSILLEKSGQFSLLPLDYNNPAPTLDFIAKGFT